MQQFDSRKTQQHNRADRSADMSKLQLSREHSGERQRHEHRAERLVEARGPVDASPEKTGARAAGTNNVENGISIDRDKAIVSGVTKTVENVLKNHPLNNESFRPQVVEEISRIAGRKHSAPAAAPSGDPVQADRARSAQQLNQNEIRLHQVLLSALNRRFEDGRSVDRTALRRAEESDREVLTKGGGERKGITASRDDAKVQDRTTPRAEYSRTKGSVRSPERSTALDSRRAERTAISVEHRGGEDRGGNKLKERERQVEAPFLDRLPRDSQLPGKEIAAPLPAREPRREQTRMEELRLDREQAQAIPESRRQGTLRQEAPTRQADRGTSIETERSGVLTEMPRMGVGEAHAVIRQTGREMECPAERAFGQVIYRSEERPALLQDEPSVRAQHTESEIWQQQSTLDPQDRAQQRADRVAQDRARIEQTTRDDVRRGASPEEEDDYFLKRERRIRNVVRKKKVLTRKQLDRILKKLRKLQNRRHSQLRAERIKEIKRELRATRR